MISVQVKKKNIMLIAAVATAVLTGCGSKEIKVEVTDFVDDVKVALADNGHIDLNNLENGEQMCVGCQPQWLRNTLRE